MTAPTISQTTTPTKKAKICRPCDVWSAEDERFLAQQLSLILSPEQRKAYLRDLRSKFNTPGLRVDQMLKDFDGHIQPSPLPDEDVIYDELADMVEACRSREHGAKSQTNLVTYIATTFIPALLFPTDLS